MKVSFDMNDGPVERRAEFVIKMKKRKGVRGKVMKHIPIPIQPIPTKRVVGHVVKQNAKTTWVSLPVLGDIIKRHNIKHKVTAA